MGALKLYGMRSAYDEIMGVAIKRQHEPPKIVGDLLSAEIAEKQARSIKYQLTIAKLPLAKDIEDFDFTGTPVNEPLIRDLAGGTFVADQRNVVLVGGTGTGKSHLAIAIARALIRNGARGRFFNVVDLVNRLETETRAGRQGRIADHLTRLDFVVFDERPGTGPRGKPLHPPPPHQYTKVNSSLLAFFWFIALPRVRGDSCGFLRTSFLRSSRPSRPHFALSWPFFSPASLAG